MRTSSRTAVKVRQQAPDVVLAYRDESQQTGELEPPLQCTLLLSSVRRKGFEQIALLLPLHPLALRGPQGSTELARHQSISVAS